MSKAEDLASYFDNFTKSSHTLQDGTPLHIAAKDHLRALDASHQRLKEALENLHALVWGECPSLLNEDSGGNSALDMDIREVIEQAKELS